MRCSRSLGGGGNSDTHEVEGCEQQRETERDVYEPEPRTALCLLVLLILRHVGCLWYSRNLYCLRVRCHGEFELVSVSDRLRRLVEWWHGGSWATTTNDEVESNKRKHARTAEG